MQTNFNPAEFLASLPPRPGVYLFYDAADKPLYIGKASNLKKRAASYFRGNNSPKTELMVRKIARAEIQQTDSESEALLLENDLIKNRRPQYNIQLRDDKSFPYIKLNKRAAFPWFTFYRGRRSARDEYFGPYPNAAAAREMLRQLHKIFRLRQCADSVFANRARPCLQHQIQRCSAPCVGLVTPAAYAEDVRQAKAMLRGRDGMLYDELGERMERAAADLDYETAALWRDRIKLLQQARGKPPALRTDADAVVVAIAADMVCFGVTAIRQGRNLGGRFHMQKNALGLDARELLTAFLSQNYLGAGANSAPREILIRESVHGKSTLQEILTRQHSHRVLIKSDCRMHRARWLAAAQLNTDDYLRSQLARRSQVEAQCDALGALLGLSEAPARVECFDISHTQGASTVGACVVFNRQGALPADYRRFNLTDITPGDDYAALAQTLTRRYQRVLKEDGKLPDVILIDGGKGQLGAARRALNELQFGEAVVVGVAKGAARKPGDEVLYISAPPTDGIPPEFPSTADAPTESSSAEQPPQNRPPTAGLPRDSRRGIRLGVASPALHFVQQIRDEAHRFAIAGHRRARAKARTESPLQSITGIGAARRRALLRHFGGLQEIARASRDEIARAPGISPALAARIYEQLHK